MAMLENLQTQKIQELRSLCSTLGIKQNVRMGKPDLIQAILQHAAEPEADRAAKLNAGRAEAAQKQPAPPRYLATDELLLLLSDLIDRGLGVTVSPDGKSWALHYDGITDSGSMTCATGVIRRCALAIMR